MTQAATRTTAAAVAVVMTGLLLLTLKGPHPLGMPNHKKATRQAIEAYGEMTSTSHGP